MGLLSLLFGWLVFPALGWEPLGGLALAFSLSNFLEVGLLLWLLWRRLRGINGRYLLDGLLRMGGAGLLMAGVTELLLWPMAATLRLAASACGRPGRGPDLPAGLRPAARGRTESNLARCRWSVIGEP
jgi:peptidoglycan biosynthesis protein MviN/MurJ (putative lipid II flippase)